MEATNRRSGAQLRATALPRQPRTIPLRYITASGLIAVLLAIGLGVYPAVQHQSGLGAGSAAGEYVTYAQFGAGSDTVYEVSASGPSERHKLLEIRHAAEYGIVPSPSPDGRQFAYTVLPPETAAPAPDSPADLWLAAVAQGARATRLGQGFDLMVRPLWYPDGRSLILRRSAAAAGPFELVRVDIASGASTSIIKSESALFPVAFGPTGGLYYASLSAAGSDLYSIDPGAGSPALVAHLSDDLTRDWALSPSGDRLAFLSLTQSAQRVSSRVQLLDIASGQIASRSSSADEFGPAWVPDGRLSFGRLASAVAANGIVAGQDVLAGPAAGFDVPLAWSRSSSNVTVRSFDGASISAPGSAALTIVSTSGTRRTIANGEVTFIGWTYR